MNPIDSLPAIRKTLRFRSVLLVTLALAPPFAFAGVNRWTNSAVQAIPGASGSPAAVDWGKIAFVSSRDGNPEIYTINTNGTNLTRLTNDPAVDEERPRCMQMCTVVLKRNPASASWLAIRPACRASSVRRRASWATSSAAAQLPRRRAAKSRTERRKDSSCSGCRTREPRPSWLEDL
jgi:hypothetical protein